jgi:hypothetical protein
VPVEEHQDAVRVFFFGSDVFGFSISREKVAGKKSEG